MPTQRISKGFKDISMSFKISPVNKDLIAVKNETAIARSIRNIVLTNPGEKFFNNDFGSGVQGLLFENIDDVTASSIHDAIEECIDNYEPRVDLIDVKVTPNYENAEFDVRLEYYIVGIDAQSQQLSFALEPTR